MMASQVFMSGGQSIPFLNVFMAPYVHGLSDERIKQAMQMFIFNLNMSYVSRGGQSLTYEAPLIIRDKNNIIRIVPIGEFVENGIIKLLKHYL
jgi:ribonucleoside-triphosphate reductase